MPGKNGQNGNGVQNNSKTKLNHSERMQKFRATKLKKKQTFRVPNSGKFEHLRKFVASYKQNEAAYNKIMSRKMAQKMEQHRFTTDKAVLDLEQKKSRAKANAFRGRRCTNVSF